MRQQSILPISLYLQVGSHLRNSYRHRNMVQIHWHMASLPRDGLFKIPTLTSGSHLSLFLLSTWDSHLPGNQIQLFSPAWANLQHSLLGSLCKEAVKGEGSRFKKTAIWLPGCRCPHEPWKNPAGRRWKILWAGWWREKCKEAFSPQNSCSWTWSSQLESERDERLLFL